MHRRPPNLVKNFAVSLVFQARLAGRAEARGDTGRGRRKEDRRLDDTAAPLRFFLRFAFYYNSYDAFIRPALAKLFSSFRPVCPGRLTSTQAIRKTGKSLVSPTSLPVDKPLPINIVGVFAYYCTRQRIYIYICVCVVHSKALSINRENWSLFAQPSLHYSLLPTKNVRRG